jgi:peptide/nickel transport system permease protein
MKRSSRRIKFYIWFGCLIIFLTVFLAIGVAPFVEESATNIETAKRFQPPSAQHVMGTDNLGRDIFARMLIGTRFTLWVSSISVAAAFVVGSGIGISLAFSGGWWDTIGMGIIDAVLSFPGILLALLLKFTLGDSTTSLIIAITTVQIPIFTRTIRSVALSVKSMPYIEAAQAIGKHPLSIIRKDVFPNSYLSNVTLIPVLFANAVVTEASLSFLGIGANSPNISWGTIISDATRFVPTQPHMWILPTLMIALFLLAVNMIADVLADRLNH